ncbi:MAG: heavy metal translocating P-type ATPase [Caldilineaceae bacterium]|nr:heavy metal translocating P-type ATPase [Caldilineaceae bacterium]
MALFTSVVLVSGSLIAGVLARRKPSPHLVDVLIDGEPKEATLLPPKQQQTFTRVKQVVQEIFSDTRRQQQQELNTTYEATEEQATEASRRQDLLVASSGLGLALLAPVVTPLLYLPSIACNLYAFRFIFQEAYRVYREERKLDYRAVWAISIPLALLSGNVAAASFGGVLGLFNFYLVAKTESRSKRHIADLFGGQIRSVWLLIDGVEVETPFEQVQLGDTVVVHAGQMIPVDGTIVEGMATIDQHMLTGESQPVEKERGELVLASTVLLSGRIHIRVDKAGDATVAAQITEMLSQTTDFKRTLESRTDRFMNQITLPILGLSALALPVAGMGGAVAVLWYYPGSRMMFFGPMSMLSYLQVAAQRGILIKDGRALESLEQIDTVVFDKTGTLTLEQPTVSRIYCYNGVSEPEILRYAAAAEAKQSHPIARAIVQAAREHGLDLPRLEDAHYKVGYGLKTQIAGRATRIGSVRFMTAEGIAVPPEVITQQLASHAQGHSLVLLALEGEVVGAIELAPTIRPEARQIIQELHARGIETAIISGDNDTPTHRLAAELGIDRYFAEVLPEDKANLVTQLQEEGHKVCFVGDGINDSIALKTADVAVSLRGATTIATDMAEIVFMNGTLGQLPELFELADDFAANMRTNMLASVLPGALGIAGTLLFGWGMGICVLLSQGSTPVGVYNAIKPMLDENQSQQLLVRK